jgi:peroxiredoxin
MQRIRVRSAPLHRARLVRSTFLIGADGTLLREWRKVKVDGHAQEVLDAVKAISTSKA